MQVGSLVKCLHDFKVKSGIEILPISGDTYTVRSIINSKQGRFLQLEEIINIPMRYSSGLDECCFHKDGFSEVQPPMDVHAIFEDQLKVPNEKRVPE